LLKLLCGQAIISIENALFHEIEIKHLQAKVNPHFIFNALSSIAELCHTDPNATEDAIVKLSTLYRYILTAEMKFVTLEEELEIVYKYLAIEKLRFGNRLSYNVNIDGNPSLVKMPSMLIQPLVENSIKHGISPLPSGGSITITATITDDRCTVSVEDTGAGTNKSTSGTGYGLKSIQKRLALHYNNEAIFEIDDTIGFKVEFSIPLELKEKSEEGVN
jgi:two-component system LytT family sensor kinase